jgi:two-component system, LytTR family, sensor histidine kinase AlgZ
MHPILGSRARLGTYLLGWVPVAAILASVGLSQGWSIPECLALALPLCLVAAFLFLSSWYLCRALPLASTRVSSHWVTWFLAAVIHAGLWMGLAWGLGQLLGRFARLADLPQRLHAAWPVLGGMGMLLYLAVLALHYLLVAQEHSAEADRTSAELRILAQDAELKALRAQLNPHFLFNSLNSISALTTLDPKRAREMCVLLSDFLRRSLRLQERPTVPLSEELDLLRAYLAIEQIRFGARLQVAWDLGPDTESLLVPTLLLQPLVENAIKHGIASLPEGGTVRIGALSEAGTLSLRVENPVDADVPPPQGLGLGLRQVRSRLQLRFGTRCRVEAGVGPGADPGAYRVILSFPVE